MYFSEDQVREIQTYERKFTRNDCSYNRLQTRTFVSESLKKYYIFIFMDTYDNKHEWKSTLPILESELDLNEVNTMALEAIKILHKGALDFLSKIFQVEDGGVQL